MDSGFIRIQGSKIYYEIHGNGEPIIFLHADTLDHRQWADQVNFFSKKYQTITFDMRGFGQSEIPPDQQYSFHDDLNQLMINLNIDRAHLVGFSLGGAIVIDFALTYPEKVQSLILADSGIGGDGFEQDFVNKINTITNLAKSDKLDEAKETWLNLEIFNFSQTNPRVSESVQAMVANTSGYRWYGINQPQNISPSAVQRLNEITIPTLILIGEFDIPDFQRKAILLHEQIPSSQLATITYAGHLSNMDSPDVFNRLTMEFLQTICPLYPSH